MADIISLKSARKQKARSIQDATAAENRVKFGRTKAEKQLAKARNDLADKLIEAHKRRMRRFS